MEVKLMYIYPINERKGRKTGCGGFPWGDSVAPGLHLAVNN
jgi:hypothetical protein